MLVIAVFWSGTTSGVSAPTARDASSTNAAAAVPSPASQSTETNSVSAPRTAPAKLTVPDPVTVEYEALLEQDQDALDEVDAWIQEDHARTRGKTAPADVTLHARVRDRLAKVRQVYDDFLLRHPDHAKAHLAYASFLQEIHEEGEALRHMEKSRELDPTDPAAWNNLANYYGHFGPVTKSFEYYAKAIELNPKEPVYVQNLATTVFLFRKDATNFYRLTEWQVFEKSLELYRQALRLDPTNFLLASDYAQTYYGIRTPESLAATARDQLQRQLTSNALTAWTNAYELASDDLQRQGVATHLARVKLNSGRFDEARRDLESVTNEVYLALKQRLLRNLEEKRKQSTEDALRPAQSAPPPRGGSLP